MRRFGIIGFLSVIAFSVAAQHSNATLVASVSGAERLSLVKNSINIPAWHEKTFWPLYEEYLDNAGEISSVAYRALEDFARIDKTANATEAFEHAKKMITHRYDLQTLRERYYAQIGNGFNGVIALQFLQNEALLDMMESSKVYEETEWRNFRFHPKAMNSHQLKTAKHNTIAAALSLSSAQAESFWKVYTRYEEECDAILGEDYSMISLYAGDPTDFTPGLAKRLGHDFLRVMQRETKLKEKYFLEMNAAAGPILAARFLAWEDYYSLVSKMYAWAEN